MRLGVDLGGTKIYAVVVDSKGRVVGNAKSPTPMGATVKEAAAVLKETAEAAVAAAGVKWGAFKSAGVAMPGVENPETLRVKGAHNLGWDDVPARGTFSKVFGKKISLGNDVDCGTLAEALAGAGRGASCVVGFFVGTGLGGGLVFDGRLHAGTHGLAGEFGHTILRKNGRLCTCGRKGCLEAYCSKVALSAKLDELVNVQGKTTVLTKMLGGNDFKRLKSSKLKKAYLKGDKLVVKLLDKMAYNLGLGTASVAAVVDPDCVVYGGGVIEALGDELMPTVKRGFADALFSLDPETIPLRVSELGDDAVAIGAALLS
jgi:glucokinase